MRALPLLALIACGAPSTGDPGLIVTPTDPPVYTSPTPEPTAPPPTPTPRPATPVPTRWTDSAVVGATLSGPSVQAWESFYDDAVEITDQILEALVEAGEMTAAEAAAAKAALQQVYKEMFTEEWLNENLSALLDGGTLEILQRRDPKGTVGPFQLDYYVLNLGDTLAEAHVGSLMGEGMEAGPGDLIIPVVVPLSTGDLELAMSVREAQVQLTTSGLDNQLDGLTPFADLETAIYSLLDALFVSLEVPETEQAQYVDQAETALEEAESAYATETLPSGGSAMPVTISYDTEVTRYEGE